MSKTAVSDEAKVMAYDAIRSNHYGNAGAALDDISEALAKARQRLDSEPGPSRQLVTSSARDILRAAAAFAEATAAWSALNEVSFFVPSVPLEDVEAGQ